MQNNVLIIFFKYPERSKVKTRLARSVGEEHALGLYKAFLRDIFETAGNIKADTVAAVHGKSDKADIEYVKDCKYISQSGKDLGERMYNAMADTFKMGYSRSILIGVDFPDLTADIINNAFEILNSNSAVIGPARDGGYYLIGFIKEAFVRKFFAGISWSTTGVLNTTLKRISDSGIRCSIIQEWEDIDDYDDLKRYNARNMDAEGHTSRYIRSYLENSSLEKCNLKPN